MGGGGEIKNQVQATKDITIGNFNQFATSLGEIL